MSKNKAKKDAAKVVATPKATPKADVKTVAEKMAALPVKFPVKAQAVKKEAPKIAPEFVTVPEACDALNFKKGIYGAYNADDKYCQDCVKDFPETAKACIHNTEQMKKVTANKKAKAASKAVTKKASTPRATVELDVFGRRVDSGAGRIDAMLLRKEGASLAEMEKERKAVGSHLSALKTEGYEITLKDGRYFAKAPAKK
jgi:hypothetical protein